MTHPDKRAAVQVAGCPICGRPAAAAHRPFCSARCRNVDLGRWLKGGYRVETDEVPEDDAGLRDQ
ncbi:MAG TPA: DNA gyrase inhibitor YacG [Stellaceae bacterium]|nr:DNA gyrase inhibitor YacG [Stellaceae bacterium]